MTVSAELRDAAVVLESGIGRAIEHPIDAPLASLFRFESGQAEVAEYDADYAANQVQSNVEPAYSPSTLRALGIARAVNERRGTR